MNILVSACLLGVECRYDGKGVLDPAVKALLDRHFLIPVCPEIMGGLATPRTPAERVNGRVMTRDGQDVTHSYQKGAQQVLELALLYGCMAAILKKRRLSCGIGKIYDAISAGRLTDGDEVYAVVVESHGIKVYGESQIERLLEESERY